MGKWLEEYSRLLLTGIAGVTLLVLILGAGLLDIIGNRAEMPKSSYEKYGDFEVFEELCKRKKPEILYHADRKWYVKESIPIDEAFAGRDGQGKTIKIELLKAADQDGNDCMSAYNPKEHQITFQQAGVYELKLRAQDEQKLCVVQKIKIPVDSRRE